MTAVEALRKARATHDCFYGSGVNEYDSTCEFAQRAPVDSETSDSGLIADAQRIHFWHASLLLDGFACAELTRAERKLER